MCGKARIQEREEAIALEWHGKIHRMDHGKESRMSECWNRKMIRIFLIGALCGVMITAAVTYVFAIPANSNYWRMEIWKRGGAAWTYDKDGHFGWKWMVQPIPDTPSQKRVRVPSHKVNAHTEEL